MKASNDEDHQEQKPAVRLMPKREVLAIAGCSYPTLWEWMRKGKFPRSREVVGKSMWLSTDVERWLADLPQRKLKGDAVTDEWKMKNRKRRQRRLKGDAPVDQTAA
jgi:predicted DNA-binding transcriptional regulator AlpA